MAKQYNFSHQLPLQSKKIKTALIILILMIGVCILGIVLANIFWDEFTTVRYSLKHRRNIDTGWPPFVKGWCSLFLCVLPLVIPMLYFMQDFKNPSIGLTPDGLFINQQLMRNMIVPYTNIAAVEDILDGYKIVFKNNEQVVKNAVFLFRPFVKSNLNTNKGVVINQKFSKGDVRGLMEELRKRIA